MNVNRNQKEKAQSQIQPNRVTKKAKRMTAIQSQQGNPFPDLISVCLVEKVLKVLNRRRIDQQVHGKRMHHITDMISVFVFF